MDVLAAPSLTQVSEAAARAAQTGCSASERRTTRASKRTASAASGGYAPAGAAEHLAVFVNQVHEEEGVLQAAGAERVQRRTRDLTGYAPVDSDSDAAGSASDADLEFDSASESSGDDA